MEIRISAVRALVAEQFPWAQLDDIVVKDNTNWWDNPHYAVSVRDDGKDKSFALVIKVIPTPEYE